MKGKNNKVILGMSGGVDSSVAAALLRKEGLRVWGVSMELYSCDNPLGQGCCTPRDRLDARRVCEQLQIPFDILDLRKPFRTQVIEYFVSEYSKGRTPLPCAPCNRDVRFKALLDYADSMDAYWIATGHYARVGEDTDGMFYLKRAKDLKKDQSYFLWGLGQRELSRLKLPIGNFCKDEVRKMAHELELPTASKRDSQELCFVGDEDHAQFLETHLPQYAGTSGDFVDGEGRVLGKHRGIHCYTIGQRRGLNVSLGERRYVLKLDSKKNQVVLGIKESLSAKGLVAKEIHWIIPRSMVNSPWSMVKIRSSHLGCLARLEENGSSLKVFFETPQEAVTPGQAAVFYQDDVCLGGGWIEKAIS